MGRLRDLGRGLAAAFGAHRLEQADEDRSVRVLAGHIGCSSETAGQLYRLARRDGYGAAYDRVFPGLSIRPIRSFA